MNHEQQSDSLDAEPIKSGVQHSVSRGMIVWLLAAISAGLNVVAIASCGIPFVPPASSLAIVLGSAGCLTALSVIVLAFLKQRAKWLLLVVGTVLLAMNGFAISLGRLGKHLIDYSEGH